MRLTELPEASGAAASHRHPGHFWTHNDSGAPEIFALRDDGRVAARVQLTGATVEDWEAIAVGPCGQASCVYLADIGDNDAERDHVTIYRLPEPGLDTTVVAVAEVFEATYPDGPQDAETILISPEGDLFIVSKGETGPVALYRFPTRESGKTTMLERVGSPRTDGKVGREDRITDGAVSPDGSRVALRTRTALQLFASADLLAGRWLETARLDLRGFDEPQGEGVTFLDASTLALVSEGGGKSRPGVLTLLTCAF